ncbi:MAG: hypothetical protein M3071_14960 [Actinomycetota bacterium]|nr:hypothetical protein [Actinomycetota bacterium]
MADPISICGHVGPLVSAVLTLLPVPITKVTRQTVNPGVAALCEVAIAGSLIGFGRGLITIGRSLIALGRGLIGRRCRLVSIRAGLITISERLVGPDCLRRLATNFLRPARRPLRALNARIA